ncbi:hypothetical protein [Streptomyces himalayensis]|uniref:Uncharacterized protein n=1 Tax=Streptomyces himalayensis subsp. himalayensis TaxID=2756131 RepID=A0A7W0DS29_9ACTN|nr:hypothetical protein [Streptomyces himalayensis]MBA2949785.1 hypothetical protein [Streptomyces himalayensis subsp. himalayensis]
MENNAHALCPSLSTAQHRPTPEGSAPARGMEPGGLCQDLPGGPSQDLKARDEDTCDLVTVPARQGLEAVDILRRGPLEAVGPVLHDGGCDVLGFLVPPGTADAWDVPGSACTQTFGRGIGTAPVPPIEGTRWLLPPAAAQSADSVHPADAEVTAQVTDPDVLREALDEAARMIAAADNCR